MEHMMIASCNQNGNRKRQGNLKKQDSLALLAGMLASCRRLVKADTGVCGAKTKGKQSGCLTAKKGDDIIAAYKAREPDTARLACF